MKQVILLILLIITGLSIAQTKKGNLATFKNGTVSAEEFKYRYEFTPQVKRQYFDEKKSREELLYTIIAEKLFAHEAEQKSYDTLKTFLDVFIPLEKMYVRDALYKREISDKVKLNSIKFNEGLRRSNKKIFVDYIYATDQKEINKTYNALKEVSKFDSVLSLPNTVEYNSELFEVTFGRMNSEAEDAIYALKINEFTKPIQAPNGWYIFRKLSEESVIYKSPQERKSKVEKVVLGRIEDSIYNDYWRRFFSNLKVTADIDLFSKLADKIYALISQNIEEDNIQENGKITLTNSQLNQLRRVFSIKELDQPFIKFEKNPLTLREFLRDFSFEGFFTYSKNKERIFAEVNGRVKRQIELELLSRKGYELGLQNLPEVKNILNIWKQNYLSTLFVKNLVKKTTLSDEDIKHFFEENSNVKLASDEVKLLELLSDSLEVIQSALNLTDNNNQFRKFIINHTKRKEAKQNNGELGFFPVNKYGEIGKIAATLNVGDVYGPLETEKGYSLFKLIEKKETQIKLEELGVNPTIEATIRYNKVKQNLEKLAVELAEKYNLSINKELLNAIKLLNSQMIVYRYMGFGGRMQAFPYSSPFFEWGEKWENKKKEAL